MGNKQSNENKKKLVIDIHNKGAKDSFGVSSILMEPNELVDSNAINQAINDVMFKPSTKMDAIGCPKYICEVLDSFKKNMLEQGISLEFVLAKEYQVVYEAFSSIGKAKLRFWYGTSQDNHTKGFINKIETFDISDSNIITIIKNIVLQSGNKL